MNVISPPSSCTVGRMRESSNSLIIITVSSSSSVISIPKCKELYQMIDCNLAIIISQYTNIGRLLPVSAFGFFSFTIGMPLAKKSMITAKISGFKSPHSASSCFETVIKSPPKNTPRTPSMRNSNFAGKSHKFLFKILCIRIFFNP